MILTLIDKRVMTDEKLILDLRIRIAPLLPSQVVTGIR
jgi:hypothetical protein